MSSEKEPKLFEFRIKYNAGEYHSHIDNYHYYNAENPIQALEFHLSMVEKHNLHLQTLSIEMYNPYSGRWEDKSKILPEGGINQ